MIGAIIGAGIGLAGSILGRKQPIVTGKQIGRAHV